MPVDLSRVGIEGLEAAANMRQTEANAALLRASALARQQETEEKEQEQQVSQIAGAAFTRIMRGDAATAQGDVAGTEDVGDRQSDAMREAAKEFFRGGLPVRGKEMLAAAAELEKIEQGLEDSKSQNRQRELEIQLKEADMVARYLRVETQSEYEHNLDFLKNSPLLSDETKAHLEALPKELHPELIRFVSDQAITAKDRANNELTERLRDQTDTTIANTDRQQAATLALGYANLKERQRENDLKQKEGQAANAPTPDQLKSAEVAIGNKLFKGVLPLANTPERVTFDAGVQSVAARAKAMTVENRSIDWGTALNRAITESQANADWPVTNSGIRFGNRSTQPDVTTFNNSGKSPDTAVPPPLDKNNKVEPPRLKKGVY